MIENIAPISGDARFEVSSCPACSDSSGDRIFNESLDGVAIDVIICARCGVGYSNPRPTEAYKLRRYKEWTAGQRPWQLETHYDYRQQLRHFGLYREVMTLIQRHFKSGLILDVGCAGGLFLVFAVVLASEHNSGLNSKYKAEGAGFDPGEVELAGRISGAPVRTLNQLSAVADGAYDAVTLLNVLEHVNRPLDLLRELRRLLRANGVMVVVVPNNELIFWKLSHGFAVRPASLAADEHINHFRPESLRRLLASAGFDRMTLVHGLVEGSYGSIARPPASNWLKYTVCRAMHSSRLAYVYPHIIAVAH